jgi:hypothetical protein
MSTSSDAVFGSDFFIMIKALPLVNTKPWQEECKRSKISPLHNDYDSEPMVSSLSFTVLTQRQTAPRGKSPGSLSQEWNFIALSMKIHCISCALK